MSLSRNVFNEFRPLFRLFDEVPLMRPSIINRYHFDEFGFRRSRHPSVDLSEQGNEYVVEADLPGIKKEDLEVRIGDQGRSVTIEGRVHSRSASGEPAVPSRTATAGTSARGDSSNEIPESATDSLTPISSEREFVDTHFTRTVWLPRPVDSSKVAGNLKDGILTLRIPKAAEQDSVTVNIQ